MSGHTPIGHVMVAATERGLCFVQVGELKEMRRVLRDEFPLGTIDNRASRDLSTLLEAVQAVASAKPLSPELPIDIRGTAFQWRVWRALTKIPRGETRSYTDIARAIGAPSSVRAVARACATNPVALVVPCHRVVRADGNLAGYRWGLTVKQRLLAKERARG